MNGKWTSVVVALLFSCTASGTSRAADAAKPEEVLKAKGLTRVGRTYLLDEDVKLPDSMRRLMTARKAADDVAAKRAAKEKEVQAARAVLADLEAQVRQHAVETLKRQKAEIFKRNQLVAEGNLLKSRHREATLLLAEREKELSGMTGEAQDKYAAAAVQLADEIDAAAARYEALAKDAGVAAALRAVDEKDPAQVMLGPSEQFKREAVFLRNQRTKFGGGPIKFEIKGGVPQVPVTLNGSLTVPMIFDSGAASISLTADVAKELGLRPGPNDPVIRLVDASGKTTEARQMTLKSVRVGTFVVENVPCAVKPASIKSDCLLGGAFLKHFVYRMDLAARELHMTQISGKPGPAAKVAAGSAAVASLPGEAGFAPLFNGKDLTGWVYGTTDRGEERKFGKGYQVRADGALHRSGQHGGRLYTEKDYANFVLRFEFKLGAGADCGLVIRTPPTGDPAVHGVKIQLIDGDDKKHKDKAGRSKLSPEQQHGSIHEVVAARQGYLKPAGEWNQQEVRAEGRRVTVVLNGHPILSCDLETIKDADVLKKHPGLKRERGRIGFLGTGSEVEFRKIRIKEL